MVLSLARVFFRDERDERDAETTENSKVCALKRCRGTKERVDTRLRWCPCVSVVSVVPVVPVVSAIKSCYAWSIAKETTAG